MLLALQKATRSVTTLVWKSAMPSELQKGRQLATLLELHWARAGAQR